MRIYWLIMLIAIAGCVPVKPTATEQYRVPQSILTVRPVPTLTIAYPPPTAKLTEVPVVPVITVDPQWKALASILQEIAQRATNGEFWEDIDFKEEGYQTCNKMILISTGTVKEDSREILKRFRWGMEFMDPGQLQEVIRILDQYN